jgi:VWFA-related protein
MKAALPLALALLSAKLAVGRQQTPPPPGAYHEEAQVERVIVDAYVTAPDGDVLPGLTKEDFRVKVDGKPVDLESVEWVAADTSETAGVPAEATAGSANSSLALLPPGRLIILFFQTSYVRSRLVGLVRMGIQARKFLGTLLPTDRVAVLSLDSHLKLRQDFTDDRSKIEQAIDDSLKTGAPHDILLPPGPSLARHLDFVRARRVVTPEGALALISQAAAPIPSGKILLYFGWGLQTIGGMAGPNARDIKDLKAAVPALAAARISIFTLDVTDAEYHSLEGTLQGISDLTGGTYQKTNVFPGLAMESIERAIAGHYVLVFPKPQGPRGYHSIDVALLHFRGTVLARSYYQD